MSWGEAPHACSVLTSPSEIHCWQLSKQRSWARWTFGLNPHCCSFILIFYRTLFQPLGPPPSALALPFHLCSVWASICGRTVISTSFIIHYSNIHLRSAFHSLRKHYTVSWDPLSQISSTGSSQLVLLTSVWCPWHFGLPIFLDVPFLSLITLNLHDPVNCALLMG